MRGEIYRDAVGAFGLVGKGSQLKKKVFGVGSGGVSSPLLSLSHVVYAVGADWQWWQNDRPPSRNILFGLVTTDLQYFKVRSKK